MSDSNLLVNDVSLSLSLSVERGEREVAMMLDDDATYIPTFPFSLDVLIPLCWRQKISFPPKSNAQNRKAYPRSILLILLMHVVFDVVALLTRHSGY